MRSAVPRGLDVVYALRPVGVQFLDPAILIPSYGASCRLIWTSLGSLCVSTASLGNRGVVRLILR